jgi:hypothetical protein
LLALENLNMIPGLRFNHSDHANRVFRHHYIPHQQLSIDESLVGTKNHTAIAIFTKQTPLSLGSKATDVVLFSVALLHVLSIYRGAKTDEDRAEVQFGLAYTVMTKLLKMGYYLSKVTTFLRTFLQLYLLSQPKTNWVNLLQEPLVEI